MLGKFFIFVAGILNTKKEEKERKRRGEKERKKGKEKGKKSGISSSSCIKSFLDLTVLST